MGSAWQKTPHTATPPRHPKEKKKKKVILDEIGEDRKNIYIILSYLSVHLKVTHRAPCFRRREGAIINKERKTSSIFVYNEMEEESYAKSSLSSCCLRIPSSNVFMLSHILLSSRLPIFLWISALPRPRSSGLCDCIRRGLAFTTTIQISILRSIHQTVFPQILDEARV